jgi:hypothetical protein
MSRSYRQVPFERALEGIAAAGFTEYVLLQRQPPTAITADTSPRGRRPTPSADRDHGFWSPWVVETLAARTTADEIDGEARRAYQFLRVLSSP